MRWRSEALDPQRHGADRLDSGEPDLDRWLREHAGGAEARRVSRTFVWCEEDGAVVAYYALAGHLLVRESLPPRVGRGSPSQIPAVLLARLALDRRLHGQGLGGALLADAMARVLAATTQVAARFVVVDAVSETAMAFYEHHGFRRIPGTLRAVQKVSDIFAALNAG